MGIAERKEREKENRRSAILDAAEEVFFSKGIENTTMDEVAERAEFSKGTLYLYFKNKNELLHGIVARGLEILYRLFQTAAEKEEKGIDKIKAIGRAYADFYKTKPNYYSAILHQETQEFQSGELEEGSNIALCQELGERIIDLLRQIVKTGSRDKTIRRDLDPAKLPIVLWGHSTGVLNLVKTKGKTIEDKCKCSSEEVIEYSFRLISDYLENDK